jgi:HTH-type transcriptional regulator/antitoxin HigA
MNEIIKTTDEHAAAITRLSALMDTDPAPGGGQADELELLAHLIEDYQPNRHP